MLLGAGTAMVYPTLLAAIGDVAHPAWRARSVGVYRLWRDGGFAVGAVLAGVVADAFGILAAIWVVAALTAASGLVVARAHVRDSARHADQAPGPVPEHHTMTSDAGCESQDTVMPVRNWPPAAGQDRALRRNRWRSAAPRSSRRRHNTGLAADWLRPPVAEFGEAGAGVVEPGGRLSLGQVSAMLRATILGGGCAGMPSSSSYPARCPPTRTISLAPGSIRSTRCPGWKLMPRCASVSDTAPPRTGPV